MVGNSGRLAWRKKVQAYFSLVSFAALVSPGVLWCSLVSSGVGQFCSVLAGDDLDRRSDDNDDAQPGLLLHGELNYWQSWFLGGGEVSIEVI